MSEIKPATDKEIVSLRRDAMETVSIIPSSTKDLEDTIRLRHAVHKLILIARIEQDKAEIQRLKRRVEHPKWDGNPHRFITSTIGGSDPLEERFCQICGLCFTDDTHK